MKVEVKETQSHEVDWSKNPQLVVDENGMVVLVHKNQYTSHSISTFVGTRLDSKSTTYYSDAFDKSQFKPFHGEITLKND